MNKVSVKIFQILYWVLLTLLIILTALPLLSSSKFKLPYNTFAVESGSMTPTINKGDFILVKRQDSYTVGDIITFRTGPINNEYNNTHRIITLKEDNTFITKGDFNNVEDVDPVTYENIIGKYISKIPLVGYPILFSRTVPGFILLIVIPSTILIYEEIRKIREEIGTKKEKEKLQRLLDRSNIN